jgi:hypothetical protein
MHQVFPSASRDFRGVDCFPLLALDNLARTVQRPTQFSNQHPDRNKVADDRQLQAGHRAHRRKGCWVLADQPVGRLETAQVFWHLDVYPTRPAAEKTKGPRGTVVEALGRVWLLTIEAEAWRPNERGERVAEIGPLPVIAGEQYTALFMESISAPGAASPAHTHPGPEAWYTAAGETCMETPEGKLLGRASAPGIVVPGATPMQLTVTGTVQRRAITLILHDSSKPPSTEIHDWTPKGLCKQ